jgi:hypothetical protein
MVYVCYKADHIANLPTLKVVKSRKPRCTFLLLDTARREGASGAIQAGPCFPLSQMLLPFGIRPDRDIACTITYRGTQCLHALTTWPYVGALDVRRTPTGQAHKNVYGAFGALLSHVQCCRSLCGRSLPMSSSHAVSIRRPLRC